MARTLQGYPGKFYCPRMATMNKPAYAAIQTHSPIKPVSRWRKRRAAHVESILAARCGCSRLPGGTR